MIPKMLTQASALESEARVKAADAEIAFARLEPVLAGGAEEVELGEAVEFAVYGEDVPDVVCTGDCGRPAAGSGISTSTATLPMRSSPTQAWVRP